VVFNKTVITASEGGVAAEQIVDSNITFNSTIPVSQRVLQEPIEQILASLRYRHPTEAQDQLNFLRTTATLDVDVTGVLDTLQLLINLAQGKSVDASVQQLNAYLRSTENPQCKDIAMSAQLRIDKMNTDSVDASSRFNAIEQPGPHTKEIFYEYFADKSTIENIYSTHRLQLSEIELCGLVRGMLRLMAPADALPMAEMLNNVAPTFNSKTLIVLTKARIIYSGIDGTHYWNITAQTQQEISDLCNDVITLLNECEGRDPRLLQLATSLLYYTLGTHKPLADVCWEYVKEVEKQHPEEAALLRQMYELSLGQPEAVSGKIIRAKEDHHYRNRTVTELVAITEITVEDSTLLIHIGDKNSIRKWHDAGGSVTGSDLLEKELNELELQVIAADYPRINEELQLTVEQFIAAHQVTIKNINPQRLVKLADRLVEIKMAATACDLLSPLMPVSDPWPSPAVCCYLNALLQSGQMMTLTQMLASIQHNNWNAFTWETKARQLAQQHDYPGAIEATERALELNKMSHYDWYLLIYLHQRNKCDDHCIAEVLSRIPDEIYIEPSEIGYKLLWEEARVGHFKKAESILVDWFVSDPEGCVTWSTFL